MILSHMIKTDRFLVIIRRKAEPPAEEDAAPAKAAAGQQLSAKGLPRRGDEGHRRMPLKQHIVFDDPVAQAGPPVRLQHCSPLMQ